MKINQLKGGAALSYATIFLTNIVGLVLTPFIIRSLGSAEYGLYTMIGALVGYMTVLDFGLNNTVVRFVAKYKAENDRKGEENFLAHSFIMYACISLLIISVGSLLYINLERLYGETLVGDQLYKAKTMMVILIFNLAISIPGGAFRGICFGYEEFVLLKSINIIRYVIRSLLVFIILIYGGDSISLVIIDTVMNLLIIGVNLFIALKILGVRIKMHGYDPSMFKSIMGFSIWLFVFALIQQLRWQYGQLIIGLFYSTTIVAIYAVGITLGNYYGAFSSAISSLFLPRAIQMTVKNASSNELTNTFIKISRVLLFILLFIFGGFIIIGKDFVFFWVGSEYEQAYYYTIIIMIGLTPILSQGFANNILEAKKLLAYRGWVLLTLTITGAIIGYFVVQRYGVLEMIFITALFMLIERVLLIPYYKKKANLDMFRYYKEISPLISIIAISIIIKFLREFLYPERNIYVVLGSALSYTSIYLMMAWYMFTDYEKSLVQGITARIKGLKKVKNKQ